MDYKGIILDHTDSFAGNFFLEGLGVDWDPEWIDKLDSLAIGEASFLHTKIQDASLRLVLEQQWAEINPNQKFVQSFETISSSNNFCSENADLRHFYALALLSNGSSPLLQIKKALEESNYRRIFLHASDKVAYESEFYSGEFSRFFAELLYLLLPKRIEFACCTSVKSHPCFDTSEYFAGEYAFANLGENDALISINKPNEYLSQHLFISRHHGYFASLNTNSTLVFPFLRKQKDKNFDLIPPQPLLYWTTPGAGTGRMFRVGGFKTMFELFNRRINYFPDRNLRTWKHRTFNEFYKEGGIALFEYFKHLEYYQIGVIHWSYDIQPALELGFPFLIQLRDPRDLITSRFFIVHQSESSASSHDFENKVIKMMRGDVVSTIPHIIRNWMTAMKYENAIFVKFEDVDSAPSETYRTIAKKLGLLPNPFISDTKYNDVMEEGIRLSLPKNNSHHFVRKGVAGDWKNWWTPRVKEVFIEQFGDVLVQLGYESDQNW